MRIYLLYLLPAAILAGVTIQSNDSTSFANTCIDVYNYLAGHPEHRKTNINISHNTATPPHVSRIDVTTSDGTDYTFFGVHKSVLDNNKLDYTQLRHALCTACGMRSDAPWIQVIGDSTPQGNELCCYEGEQMTRTQAAYQFISKQLGAIAQRTAMCEYGCTGHVWKWDHEQQKWIYDPVQNGQRQAGARRDINTLVTDWIDTTSHQAPVVGNLVGHSGHLMQHKGAGPHDGHKVRVFTMVYNDQPLDPKASNDACEYTRFGDDTTLTDNLLGNKDHVYLISGGQQCFAQISHLLNNNVPITALTGTRSNRGRRFFDMSQFLYDVINRERSTEQSEYDRKHAIWNIFLKNHHERHTFDSQAPDANTKDHLHDEGLKKFFDAIQGHGPAYKHIDRLCRCYRRHDIADQNT